MAIADLSVQAQNYSDNNHEASSNYNNTFIYAMFPVDKGSYYFNNAGEQEWQLNANTETSFIVYGTLQISEALYTFPYESTSALILSLSLFLDVAYRR